MDDAIKDKIESKMDKRLMTTNVLLSGVRMLDNKSKKSPAFTDHRYIPFFYYLGSELKPKNACVLGFDLGLISTALLIGSKETEYFFGFQKEDEEKYYYKMGYRNVIDRYQGDLDIYLGHITDEKFQEYFCATKWDLIIINQIVEYDEYIQYLELCWKYLNFQGSIVIDYVTRNEKCKNAYMNFCKMQSRDPMIFKTRHGVGYIRK